MAPNVRLKNLAKINKKNNIFKHRGTGGGWKRKMEDREVGDEWKPRRRRRRRIEERDRGAGRREKGRRSEEAGGGLGDSHQHNTSRGRQLPWPVLARRPPIRMLPQRYQAAIDTAATTHDHARPPSLLLHPLLLPPQPYPSRIIAVLLHPSSTPPPSPSSDSR